MSVRETVVAGFGKLFKMEDGIANDTEAGSCALKFRVISSRETLNKVSLSTGI